MQAKAQSFLGAIKDVHQFQRPKIKMLIRNLYDVLTLNQRESIWKLVALGPIFLDTIFPAIF